MDAWNWLVEHPNFVMMVAGPVVSLTAILFIFLPVLIASTPHARSQTPPVSAIPIMPGQHFRFVGYAFSGDAWRSGGIYQRTILFLFRTAFLLGGAVLMLLFAVMVTAQIRVVS
ncbi:MAG: hypothetical protein Q8L23_00840 [Caulobacter sp.]|nr:hypothetical protein [Caulobacter sp.]